MTSWATVPLGDVLAPVSRAEAPVSGRLYRQLGVRLWGAGAYERDSVDGASTKYRSLNRVAAWDVVVNKIWARHGSIAVVPPALEGCYVSAEFPLFLVDRDRTDPGWLRLLTQWSGFWRLCGEAAQGTSGKNRIRPERFLAIRVPLPPLADQRRIAGTIDAIASRLGDVDALQRRVTQASQDLCRALIFNDGEAVAAPLGTFLTPRPPDVLVRADESYQFAGVFSFGRGVFRSGVREGLEISYERLTRLRAGDLVYPKLMAWEGAFGVVPPECDSCVVSTEFPVFAIDETKVLREVVDTYLRTPSVWPALTASSTGTNVRRRRLNPQNFLAHEMPVPSRRTQQRLKDVRAQVAEIDEQRALRDASQVALLQALIEDGLAAATAGLPGRPPAG
jgi:type I restriction enzyme, S subunit